MVCSASPSALDALALVRAGRGFDIALLDAQLPMMDAVQLASALRHLPAGHRFPLVLLSDRPKRSGRSDRSEHAPDTFAAVLTRRPASRDLFTTISHLLAQEPTVAVAGHPEAVTGVR
jgi:CheY-like chemotaxis protein